MSISCRVDQLCWFIEWEENTSFSMEREEEAILKITFCRKRNVYKILEGSNLLKEASERKEEFINVIFVQ